MESHRDKTERVMRLLDSWPTIDRSRKISTAEFRDRRRRVWHAISAPPYSADLGFVFCDEHYSGDVPYLFGNTNVSIEQVAGALGPDEQTSGIIAGFEGVYIAGQLAEHGGTAFTRPNPCSLPTKSIRSRGLRLKTFWPGSPARRLTVSR